LLRRSIKYGSITTQNRSISAGVQFDSQNDTRLGIIVIARLGISFVILRYDLLLTER
jgi:hypothetical protein